MCPPTSGNQNDEASRERKKIEIIMNEKGKVKRISELEKGIGARKRMV